MSPRVAYWTNSFEPGLEAIASEVALLRGAFPASVAWGLSHRRLLLLSRSRGYCVHPRLHILFRLATRILESRFDLHHVFGSVGDWFYLNRPRRQPTVLTVAAHSRPVELELLQRVDRFAVEYPQAREDLARQGIDPRRIRLIYPPVHLSRFHPSAPPAGPFTVLFASSPEKPSWLAARGVHLLLEAAALRPQVRFRLLWRPWGSSEGVVRQWIAERGLHNVELRVGRWEDMAAQYRDAHVCAAPFTDPERAKPAPNSVVESLACGRPVLVTGKVGLAELVEEGKAGCVSSESGESIAEHLDRLAADWADYAAAARALAESRFGQDQFLDGYRRLYAEALPIVSTSVRGAWRKSRHRRRGARVKSL